ncbi:Protein kinase-like domain containing protein [Rhypophila sp. PSN 637]
MLEFVYRAPEKELPAPLPTIAQIEASTAIPRRFTETQVRLVKPHFVVKVGRGIKFAEGDNMLFARKHSDLIVPTLYAAFHDTDTKKNYLVMEYIHGPALSMVWNKLDKEAKDSVASQLRKGLDQLRKTPSPGHLGGLKGENPWNRMSFGFPVTGLDGKEMKTGHDWVEVMCRAAQKENPMKEDCYKWITNIYHNLLDSTSGGDQAVFTHADIHMENIMMREGDNKVVLLDWEKSGFYPPYYEYLLAMCEERWYTDWGNYVCRFLDQHPRELFLMYHFRSWYVGGKFTLPKVYIPNPPSQYVMAYWLDHLDEEDEYLDYESDDEAAGPSSDPALEERFGSIGL